MSTPLLLAILAAGITWLARGSGRRLGVLGSVGLLIAFFALPFVAVVGARSDQALGMTPFGLSFVYPLLWTAPVLALVALLLSLRGSARVGGLALAGAGLVGIGLPLVFQNGSEQLLSVRSVPGVLEVLFPLVIGVALGLLALGQRGRQRAYGLVIALAVPLTLLALLASGTGERLFPDLRGYYKLAAPVAAQQAALVVNDWQADLEFYNEDAQKLARDWQTVRRQLATGGYASTERAKQRRDFYRIRQDYADRRLEPGTVPTLQAISTAGQLPFGYAPGPDASEAGVRRVLVRRADYGFGAWILFAGLALGGGLILVGRGALAQERGDLRNGLLLAGVVTAVLAGFNSTEFNLRELIIGWPNLVDLIGRSWPPDTGFISEVMKQMLVTVNIALIGTVVAAAFALPLSLLAARNLTFRNALMRFSYVVTRTFFNVDRGVDTLILALIIVSAVGLGPFAGALAMAVHSIADLGKLYSEAIENAERGPIEALESVGAPGTSVIRWGLMPQVLPLFLSYTLYRFEINFRVSIVLGFVGAGGIGFLLNETMRAFQYQQAMVGIITIVLVVNLLDFISAEIRRRLV
ncbi:phosphonate ABC transporter, permease protein PhnE [Deinococcus peraridilitoris]|uniref:Phosphonate ABC transporter, permease protein PhnE n=1 Tax=Deinococcus peraridilitoris (strain DSM 19664 / LMG 22246 / CIP 109416 / KR-200) TaxID=937777 RepID=K9ZXH3_DEIPD|nr:phosphonate ABC transporter, permease protein PhnE [Deinococcus peraridilitoris]AFZ66286.1 phosphonate ABC transporter, permease protein PhnE [Deinococcus peraridilitoris DSM 19664]